MNLLKILENFKAKEALKIFGIIFAALFVLALASQLIGGRHSNFMPLADWDEGPLFAQNSFGGNASIDSDSLGAPLNSKRTLSPRNIANESIVNNGFTSGSDAEDFEVAEYYATIKTSQLDNACNKILALKQREEIIFESANTYKHGCNYSFKVKNNQLPYTLETINSLQPDDLRENKFTIKQQVDDFSSESQVLLNKQKSIDDTLDSAIKAYDEVFELAIRTHDVENLARIIESKLKIIERLTNEKIRINERLDRLAQAKAKQLDRLDYAYFHVNIYENKYIDIDSIKNSWRVSVKRFIQSLNTSLQNVSINLAAFIFRGLEFALYFIIVLLVIKYGWRFSKRIWQN